MFSKLHPALKVVIGVMVLAVIGLNGALYFQPPLGKIQQIIEADHPNVVHISATEYVNLNPDEIVVFDVRETEEYEVSHLDGAIQVPPNIDPQEFAEDYGELLNGKQAVFYCSVGRRSSDLIARLDGVTQSLGAQSSVNLVGGVFEWVNGGGKLNGDKVHPYNDYWGRLIKDQSKVSYSPVKTAN